MTGAPVITVVIPTHHRRKLLLRLLDSLDQQTLPASQYEVIVVHNFTDDGTEEAVAQWSKSSALNLRYYKKNYPGPASSRQFGATEARGQYVAFIDDDCYATESWLQSACRYLEMKGQEDGEGKPLGLLQGRTIPFPGQPRRYLEKTISILEATVFFETCNIIYPKSVFEDVGGFSAEFLEKFYGEDTDLGWKVREAGYRTEFSSDCLVYHEVFHVGVWKWLKEPLYFRNLPYLTRKFPALRESMFFRYFLTRETASYHLFLLGFLLFFFYPVLGLALTFPYFALRFISGSGIDNMVMRLARIVTGIPRGFFMWWALTSGSIRARSPLL